MTRWLKLYLPAIVLHALGVSILAGYVVLRSEFLGSGFGRAIRREFDAVALFLAAVCFAGGMYFFKKARRNALPGTGKR